MKRWTADDKATLFWLLVYAALFVGGVLYVWLSHDTRCFGVEC